MRGSSVCCSFPSSLHKTCHGPATATRLEHIKLHIKAIFRRQQREARVTRGRASGRQQRGVDGRLSARSLARSAQSLALHAADHNAVASCRHCTTLTYMYTHRAAAAGPAEERIGRRWANVCSLPVTQLPSALAAHACSHIACGVCVCVWCATSSDTAAGSTALAGIISTLPPGDVFELNAAQK